METDTLPSLKELEANAIASMQERPIAESLQDRQSSSPSSDKTPAQKANESNAQPDDSGAQSTPSQKANEQNAQKPSQPEAQKQPADDKPAEKHESDYAKKAKDEGRRVKTWTEINSRREQMDAEISRLNTEYSQREMRVRQLEERLQLQARNAREGKLPNYKHSDGKEYAPEIIRGSIEQCFHEAEIAREAGDEREYSDAVMRGQQAIDALVGVARQAGLMDGLEPSPQQVHKAKQEIALQIAGRKELDPSSGSKVSQVLKVFFDDPEYGRFIARRENGIADAVGLADMIAKGIESGDKDKRIAELEKQLEEKGQTVAEYEKKTAPARAGVTRKPASPDNKPASEKSTSELEAIVRKQYASGEIRWGN